LLFCSDFDRNDLTSHIDMTYSQLNGLRELINGSPQISIDPNLMLEVGSLEVSCGADIVYNNNNNKTTIYKAQ